jgi:4-diphosphocytidyl-2-C-methyl-D-erythritol kinase
VKTAAAAFSVPAHAKLNLRLEVGPKTGDLHSILSVITELELADELELRPSSDGFRVTCDLDELSGRDNVVWRAAQALGVELPDVCIAIAKRIPTQAGLGGGSADAAAALRALTQILREHGVTVAQEGVMQAALSAGSDIPALLAPGLKIVSGVGDTVALRYADAPPWGIVLLHPGVGSSTARAYQLLDGAAVPHALSRGAFDAAEAMCDAFAAADLDRFLGLLHNDFSEAVERALPQVADARERLERAGAHATILCGSGSCVAGFFDDRAAALEALQFLQPRADEWVAVTEFAQHE